jgi:hypothetical protein
LFSINFFKYIFFGVPHLATCIFLFFYNEPELGVGIDPGMALTPLTSSIGWGLNPRPSDHEMSAQPLNHSFCIVFYLNILYIKIVSIKRALVESNLQNVFFWKQKTTTFLKKYFQTFLGIKVVSCFGLTKICL